jgi:D-glycero-D-manno-heptose 1,7-bisphosphate phosphatase
MKKEKQKAVFFDRDGVLNELVLNEEDGQISSPLSVRQLRVFPYAGKVIKAVQTMGFLAILVSNQPGVAKKQLSYSQFIKMKEKLAHQLAKQGASLDAEYYCLHHPNALITKYKVKCYCRKPKPGLILRAASEKQLDLARSFFVGDALVDVEAGEAAGCNTILISHMTNFLNQIMKKKNVYPDYLVDSLNDVPQILLNFRKN